MAAQQGVNVQGAGVYNGPASFSFNPNERPNRPGGKMPQPARRAASPAKQAKAAWAEATKLVVESLVKTGRRLFTVAAKVYALGNHKTKKALKVTISSGVKIIDKLDVRNLQTQYLKLVRKLTRALRPKKIHHPKNPADFQGVYNIVKLSEVLQGYFNSEDLGLAFGSLADMKLPSFVNYLAVLQGGGALTAAQKKDAALLQSIGSEGGLNEKGPLRSLLPLLLGTRGADRAYTQKNTVGNLFLIIIKQLNLQYGNESRQIRPSRNMDIFFGQRAAAFDLEQVAGKKDTWVRVANNRGPNGAPKTTYQIFAERQAAHGKQVDFTSVPVIIANSFMSSNLVTMNAAEAAQAKATFGGQILQETRAVNHADKFYHLAAANLVATQRKALTQTQAYKDAQRVKRQQAKARKAASPNAKIEKFELPAAGRTLGEVPSFPAYT